MTRPPVGGEGKEMGGKQIHKKFSSSQRGKMAFRDWLLVLFASRLSLSGCDGLRNCPSTNFSLSEDSSMILAANITNHDSILDLYKKNESTSDWEYVLCIRNGHISCWNSEHASYFSLSHNDFAVKNAKEVITGYYKFVRSLNSSCMQQFFIAVFGSKGTDDIAWIWICSALSILVVVAVLVAVPVTFCLIKRNRRGGDRVERVPGCENGSPACMLNGIQMDNLAHVVETTEISH
nr:uncharacterized protein LOC110091634 [Pogona vitticeps]